MCYLPLLVVLPATIQSQSSSSQGSSDPKQQKGQSEQNWEGTRMGGGGYGRENVQEMGHSSWNWKEKERIDKSIKTISWE